MGRIDFGFCYRCQKPATGSINIYFNAASGTPSLFYPVCDDHNYARVEYSRKLLDKLKEKNV